MGSQSLIPKETSIPNKSGSNPDQVVSLGENLEDKNTYYIMTEDPSPYQSLDRHIVITVFPQIKAPESMFKRDMEEQVHNDGIQEHIGSEVSTTLNLNVRPSLMHEKVHDNEEE